MDRQARHDTTDSTLTRTQIPPSSNPSLCLCVFMLCFYFTLKKLIHISEQIIDTAEEEEEEGKGQY